MPGITSRGGLLKPQDGESADNDTLNVNFDRIADYGMGAYPCTSTTRPNQPWLGLAIFETDTGAFGKWDGTRWLLFDTRWQNYIPEIRHGNEAGALLTGANNYLVGRYFRQGQMTKVKAALQLGAGANSVSTGVLFAGLPFPRVDVITLPDIVGVWRGSTGSASYHGLVYLGPGTTKSFNLDISVGGTFDTLANNTTFPASPAYWTAELEYQAA